MCTLFIYKSYQIDRFYTYHMNEISERERILIRYQMYNVSLVTYVYHVIYIKCIYCMCVLIYIYLYIIYNIY